ncbi:glycosyltransferase family 2 protein [Georgenia sp. SYP-B2076]|uniref:glycosyltransferase family 2 protein n=1 Tax=Georgenia sp. SYP-B2076 TaxID=2495881 RepID=UPI0013E0D90D|nr:glycosyltransferase family 2 protein [Georgenia sp. SYP-B2076]
MRTVDVSVVVPVKDDAALLERCLLLLAEQSVAPREVIVVDNASSDHSALVAAAHGARVVREPHPGIPAAASAGYDAAVGEVIVRCDADTAPGPDWLERIWALMSDDPGLDAVTGTGQFYDVGTWRARLVRPLYLGAYYLLVHAALGHPPLWGSNMAVRRATWREVRHLVHRDDAELHDDIDLAFALGPERRISYDPGLCVGVSGRSLRGGAQLRRRVRRAGRTLAVNWRVAPPWERWARRFAARAAARAAASRR